MQAIISFHYICKTELLDLIKSVNIEAPKYKFWYFYNLFLFSSFLICLSTKLVKPKKRKARNDLSERLQEAELGAFKAIGELKLEMQGADNTERCGCIVW